MRYLILLYGDEEAEGSMSDEERRAVVEQHIAFGQKLRKENAFAGSGALGDSGNAKVLRRESGRALVTDGPFAETKEQLGGFYLLECEGIEDALRWAEQVPRSPGLLVEIRPIVEV
jgi:hypothetical protein